MLGVIYLTTTYIPPGLGSLSVYLVALGISAVTALARVNDIGRGLVGKRWHARRIGLTLVGVGAVTMGLAALKTPDTPPSWFRALFHVGLALTWITTPHMPPWYRWITRSDPKELPKDGAI